MSITSFQVTPYPAQYSRSLHNKKHCCAVFVHLQQMTKLSSDVRKCKLKKLLKNAQIKKLTIGWFEYTFFLSVRMCKNNWQETVEKLLDRFSFLFPSPSDLKHPSTKQRRIYSTYSLESRFSLTSLFSKMSLLVDSANILPTLFWNDTRWTAGSTLTYHKTRGVRCDIMAKKGLEDVSRLLRYFTERWNSTVIPSIGDRKTWIEMDSIA